MEGGRGNCLARCCLTPEPSTLYPKPVLHHGAAALPAAAAPRLGRRDAILACIALRAVLELDAVVVLARLRVVDAHDNGQRLQYAQSRHFSKPWRAVPPCLSL